MAARHQPSASVLPRKVADRPHRRHGHRWAWICDGVDAGIPVQDLPGLTRFQVHHAGVVKMITNTMRQQCVIRHGEDRRMHQQRLNGSRFNQQRTETLGEFAEKFIMDLVGIFEKW